jgi:hypothetical protein
MVTVLDGPTANNATASNSENGKNKILSTEQSKFIKTNLVVVVEDDFLWLNCSMDYCFFLLMLPVIVLLKKKKKPLTEM